MWPGLVGKGDGEGEEPPFSLERMLDLTANAEVNGRKFDGVDCFLFHPHTDPEASDDQLKETADLIAGRGFDVGSWLLLSGRVRLEIRRWGRRTTG